MDKIKKGDIVGRKSYNKDILFVVDKIIKLKNGEGIAILKGLDIRIQADSYVSDLELIEKIKIEENRKIQEKRFKEKIEKGELLRRSNKIIYTGKILHLDGDTHLSNLKSLNYRTFKATNITIILQKKIYVVKIEKV